MTSKVSLPRGGGDLPHGLGSRDSSSPAAPALGAADTTQEAEAAQRDLRLIIDQPDQNGPFVYTVVDRANGEVVSQMAREEVLQMKDRPGYCAGNLFKGSA